MVDSNLCWLMQCFTYAEGEGDKEAKYILKVCAGVHPSAGFSHQALRQPVKLNFLLAMFTFIITITPR